MSKKNGCVIRFQCLDENSCDFYNIEKKYCQYKSRWASISNCENTEVQRIKLEKTLSEMNTSNDELVYKPPFDLYIPNMGMVIHLDHKPEYNSKQEELYCKYNYEVSKGIKSE